MRRLSHWPWWRRWFGTQSERAAASFLRRLGYRILKHNYRAPRGEIDLIAWDGAQIVFVEVRSTAGADTPRVAESIDRTKQKHITHAARHFLHEYRLFDRPCRFDVIILQWLPNAKSPTIQHLKSAFDCIEY